MLHKPSQRWQQGGLAPQVPVPVSKLQQGILT